MWFIFAALAASCFGLRGICYQWSSRRPINRHLMLFGVYLSGALITLTAALALRQSWNLAAGVGAVIGLCSFISNASMYRGFAVGKTSLIAMFSGLPPVVVVLLAYAAWGETLNHWQLSAFILILAGLLMVRYSNDLSLRNLQGAQWGVLVMVFFGFSDFLTKLATLQGAELFPTLVLMFAAGSVCFGMLFLAEQRTARASATLMKNAKDETAASASRESGDSDDSEANRGREERSVAEAEAEYPAAIGVKPPRLWSGRRTLLWGMAVGLTNAGGMIFAMLAFEHGITGLVSAVLAANLLIVMLYARFALKEKFSRLETGGLMIAFIGMILLKVMA